MDDWTVSELRPNVHRISFDGIAAGWEGWALLRSDAHHDSPHARRDLELEHLELARQRNAPVIDYGDLFDAMGGRYDPRKMDSVVRPEHRVDHYFDSLVDGAAEFYGPYADLFAVLGPGNHETAVLKQHSLNLTHSLARQLRQVAGRQDRAFVGGYSGYVLFHFQMQKTVRSTLRLKYHHGYGGNAPVTDGIIDAKRRAQVYPDAHIIATGHIHKAWVHPVAQERMTEAGVVRSDMQWHICTPGYKDGYGQGMGGWEIEKGMGPSFVGACWLHFRFGGDARNRARVQVEPIGDWRI